MQKWSLLLGIAAFGSYALLTATTSGYKDQTAVFYLLLTFGAGLFQANATRFFYGVSLAIFCMCAYNVVGLTEREQSSAGTIILLMFAVILGFTGIAFFTGYLVRRIANAFRGRKSVNQ